MPFTFAALYFRDNASRVAVTPDPNNLPAAQKLEFNNSSQILQSVEEVEQPNVSDDPAYDAGGNLVVEKQFNGTFGYSQVLNIISDDTETVFRKKIRTFARKVPIEPAFHEFGIFGFFHPVITDFNVDPTDDFGYTIDQPTHTHIHGTHFVRTTITLRIGGRLHLIP